MRVWELYLDESYNSHVFCVGGFLAPPGMWTEIVYPWRERIAYENRESAKKGFPPISRYHATDCASLKKEFDKKHGWDIPRQILLTKAICKIIGRAGPCGVAVGGRIADVRQHFDPTANTEKKSLYDLCFRMSLLVVGKAVRDQFPGTAIKVIYDQTMDFGSIAKGCFESLRTEPWAAQLNGHFTELIADDSRSCTQLQSADFFAYESMRRLDGVRRGNSQIRKSLQNLIGAEIPIHIQQFTENNFTDMHRMIENKKAGRRIDEDVESKLLISVSSLTA